MRLTVIAVSRRGAQTALRLAEALPNTLAFVPARFDPGESWDGLPAGTTHLQSYEGRAGRFVAEQFSQRVPLVLVMAVGAAVRLIAPLLRNKTEDPPVVVVDDLGRFAISLVSGHSGGANRLAQEIAACLGAEAVITTASDAAGLPAIDEIARERGWWIEPESRLTRLAAAIINGESVGIYQDAGERDWLDESAADHLCRYDGLDELAEAMPSVALIISDRQLDIPDVLAERSVICRPPVLVLGAGSSSGADAEEIAGLVDRALAGAGLSALSAFAIATIDRRGAEPGLVAFAQQRRLQIVTYTPAELDTTQGDWARSDVVRNAVGTGAVAEPAALRCAGVSSLLVRKVKSTHVTLAVARVASGPDDAARRPPSGARGAAPNINH